MLHRLEILNIRDRYMIGDWVLNNGKPYRWTADDYNRSQIGMKDIEPMPLSKNILNNNFVYDGNCRWMSKQYKDLVVLFAEGTHNCAIYYIDEQYKYYDTIPSVSEVQHVLRTQELYRLAENFKV